MICGAGCINVHVDKGKTKKKESRITFNCSNSIGAQLHNVRVNFKTLKICFSRKKITSHITSKKIVYSAQYWKPFSPPNCFTKQNYWHAKLLLGALSKPDQNGSIKFKLAIAHISELPLLTKVSIHTGCIIWSTIQVCYGCYLLYVCIFA